MSLIIGEKYTCNIFKQDCYLILTAADIFGDLTFDFYQNEQLVQEDFKIHYEHFKSGKVNLKLKELEENTNEKD